MITDEMINDWRINYGLDVSSPEDAGRWWSERNDGKAPAGAVAALGLCIEEIERLRAWQRRAIQSMRWHAHCEVCAALVAEVGAP